MNKVLAIGVYALLALIVCICWHEYAQQGGDGSLSHDKGEGVFPPLEQCALPKVLAVHWQDCLNVDDEQIAEWEVMISTARSDGYNGMLMVLHNDAPNRDVEEIVALCRQYLRICEHYSMEFHLSFSALEGACEMGYLNFWDIILSPIRGIQPLWQSASRSASRMVDSVVRSLQSPYFCSVTLLQQPQCILSATKRKYEEAMRALADSVWSINPSLNIVVSSNFAELEGIAALLSCDADRRFIRSGHFYPSELHGCWKIEDVQQALECVPPGAFVSMVHFDEYMRENEKVGEDQRGHFLSCALDVAVHKRVHVGIFGHARLKTHRKEQHERHSMPDRSRIAVAKKIKKLRKNNLVAPQLPLKN